MAHRNTIAAPLCLALISVASAPGQTHNEIGRDFAAELDLRDGRVNDAGLVAYVQSVADRLAAAASSKPVEIRLTRSSDRYAAIVPEDLIHLRSSTEDDMPGGGYRIDSSQFHQQRAKFAPPAARPR